MKSSSTPGDPIATHACKLALPLFFLTSLVLRAGDLPAADEFANSLTRKLYSVISAHSLFVQDLQESRPTEELAHSLEVLADEVTRG
jgi:hypothetical protein